MRNRSVLIGIFGVVASSYVSASLIFGALEDVRAKSIVILDPEGRVAFSMRGVGPGAVQFDGGVEGGVGFLMKVVDGGLIVSRDGSAASVAIDLGSRSAGVSVKGDSGSWNIVSDDRSVAITGESGADCSIKIAASDSVAALELSGQGGVAHVRAEQDRGVVVLANGVDDAPCEARMEVQDQSAVFGVANSKFKGVQVVSEAGVGYKMYEDGRIIGQVAAKEGESSVVMRYGKSMSFVRSTLQLGEVGVAGEAGRHIMSALNDRVVRCMDRGDIVLEESVGDGAYVEVLKYKDTGVGEKREMRGGSGPSQTPLDAK